MKRYPGCRTTTKKLYFFQISYYFCNFTGSTLKFTETHTKLILQFFPCIKFYVFRTFENKIDGGDFWLLSVYVAKANTCIFLTRLNLLNT